jgi:hypothetical protein
MATTEVQGAAPLIPSPALRNNALRIMILIAGTNDLDLDAETKRLYHAEMQTVKAESEWAAEWRDPLIAIKQ